MDDLEVVFIKLLFGQCEKKIKQDLECNTTQFLGFPISQSEHMG